MIISKYLYRWIVFLSLFLFLRCNPKPIDCETTEINIENRWYIHNRGKSINNEISDIDKKFICERIKSFGKGEKVGVNDSYGNIEIYINNRQIQAIFTYKNGVVYRVGIGKYVYDEELTEKIMEIMQIKKRCWGTNCE